MCVVQVALKIIRKAALRTARTLELLANEMKVRGFSGFSLYIYIYYIYPFIFRTGS